MSEEVEYVRVYIVDGSYADFRLVGPWEAFIHQLVTNGAAISTDTFVNRASIIKAIRMRAIGGPESELLHVEAKGTA